MNDNKAYISSLIDSVHELAGLLQLALSEGEIPAALPGLIKTKAGDIASRCAEAADKIDETLSGPADAASLSDSYSLDDEDMPEQTVVSQSESRPTPFPAAVEETAAPAPAPVPAPTYAPKKKPAGVFTLNDRFLFTRELFGGRRELFDRAMVDLAGMDSYEEAEDFFLYQHGMNPDDPAVERFLMLVARLF